MSYLIAKTNCLKIRYKKQKIKYRVIKIGTIDEEIFRDWEFEHPLDSKCTSTLCNVFPENYNVIEDYTGHTADELKQIYAEYNKSQINLNVEDYLQPIKNNLNINRDNSNATNTMPKTSEIYR
jgi:hypothetical protein